MNPLTPRETYAAKEERRRQLAALPVAERLQLIEKLHAFGLEMRKWKRAHSEHDYKPE